MRFDMLSSTSKEYLSIKAMKTDATVMNMSISKMVQDGSTLEENTFLKKLINLGLV